jgi:hypothetical protein
MLFLTSKTFWRDYKYLLLFIIMPQRNMEHKETRILIEQSVIVCIIHL